MRWWVWALGLMVACDEGGGAAPDPGDASAVADQAVGGDAAPSDGGAEAGPTDAAGADAGSDAVAPGCPQPAPAGLNEVAIAQGLVRGRQVGSSLIFLGIPFAAQPEGDLRWAPPAPPGCLPAGGLDATRYGPACPQLGEDGQVVGDEACLQLNVFAPTAPGPHAVMVFIHGGGNVQGSASVGAEPIYDGAALAEQFGVVVVTIQYRLGALGWLRRPSLADSEGNSGNYGLLDQVAALEWVQAHIGAFGGDPGRVMIFGESAGAVNTCALVASPRARGLFQASLMESGACLLPAVSEVERASREQVEAVACAMDDEAQCLRRLPAVELILAYPPVVGVSARGTPFQPAIDGVIVPDQPEAVIRAGQHNRGAFIIGANADETALAVPDLASAAAYESAVRAQFGPVLGAQVLEVYPAADFPSPRHAMVAVTTDARFVCPTRRAARAAALHGPTWLYHFTHALENAPRLGPLGAYHGLELFFVFQNLDFAGYRASAAERALAAAMGGYWTRFAATGNPNGAGAVEWPPYEAATDRHLTFDGDGIEAGSGLRQARCDFWDGLIDGAGN